MQRRPWGIGSGLASAVIARSAYVEAVAHLTKGLEVLQTLPDTPERTQHELDMQIALGQALQVTKGRSAPEVGHAYARPVSCANRWGTHRSSL